jgi:pentatricopeptide repeat protein
MFELMGALTLAGRMEEARALMDEILADSNPVPNRIYNFFFP